jgi:hypothetical protein
MLGTPSFEFVREDSRDRFHHDEGTCGICNLCNANKYKSLSAYVCSESEDAICKSIFIFGRGGLLR